MSELEVHGSASKGTTLERGRSDVLDSARPLPPDGDVVIDDLTEDEDRLFLAAILEARICRRLQPALSRLPGFPQSFVRGEGKGIQH